MKILNKLMFGLAFSVLTFLTSPVTSYCVTNAEITEVAVGKAGDRFPVEVTTETVTLETVKSSQPVIEVETLERSYISDEDLTLLTLLTMAEAEGESEEGKRLVIDTVLNRVDSEHFPDTISEVIYQKGQFTSMHNGRVDRVDITEEVVRLVEEEVNNRTNYGVVFFHADHYGKYGVPMFSVGNHYFSSYE